MKKIDEKELKEILEAHAKWLQDPKQPGAVRANLQNADLRVSNLQGVHLQRAHLRGANLHGADLQGAYLDGANLRGAILQGANFREANLQEADLFGVNLDGAHLQAAHAEGAKMQLVNLRKANLQETHLEGANLQTAHLEGADLRKACLEIADLEGADLEGADLREADLQGANFRGVDLQGANFQGAHLQGANLQEANLLRASLQEADLQGANFLKANLLKTNLQEANLQEANLQGTNLLMGNFQEANLREASLQETHLEGANLQGAHLEGADLRNACLEMADLEGADLRRAGLEGANFRGANLQGAILEGADLEGHDFQDANLERADLRGTDLWEADLRGAKLDSADLRGSDLTGANLEGASLYSCIVTRDTKLKEAKFFIKQLEMIDDTWAFIPDDVLLIIPRNEEGDEAKPSQALRFLFLKPEEAVQIITDLGKRGEKDWRMSPLEYRGDSYLMLRKTYENTETFVDFIKYLVPVVKRMEGVLTNLPNQLSEIKIELTEQKETFQKYLTHQDDQLQAISKLLHGFKEGNLKPLIARLKEVIDLKKDFENDDIIAFNNMLREVLGKQPEESGLAAKLKQRFGELLEHTVVPAGVMAGTHAVQLVWHNDGLVTLSGAGLLISTLWTTVDHWLKGRKKKVDQLGVLPVPEEKGIG